jgi:hypothetical protein
MTNPKVKMTHPDLEGSEINVFESAVPHHAASGWEVVIPEEETSPVDGPKEETDSKASESETTKKGPDLRTSRTKKES